MYIASVGIDLGKSDLRVNPKAAGGLAGSKDGGPHLAVASICPQGG
jgi:hypothetical protein